MALNIRSVNEGNVLLKFEDQTVTISGTIDCQNPGKFIAPFLNDVHKFILKTKIKIVNVDIITLDFLNSSAIEEFVEWIMKLKVLKKDQKYVIKFLCNHEFSWQEPSLKTLAFLNSEQVKIEVN
ncbi:MAG: hypothetical protein KAT05_12520 [Spirochaetes bacterium]|nr:hypothetical protein [Spirochaetota bacterium]